MRYKAIQESISDFLTPFKSDAPKFREQSVSYTLGLIMTIMKIPALFSLALGLLILISPDKADLDLLAAIDENFQNIGFTIALYSTSLIYGLILLTCTLSIFVCNFFRYILNATTYLGFLIVSVSAGIALGLIIPTFIELKINTEISAYFAIIFQLMFIGICCQFMNKPASHSYMVQFITNVEKSCTSRLPWVRHSNLFIYENKRMLRIIFGIVLIALPVIRIYTNYLS